MFHKRRQSIIWIFVAIVINPKPNPNLRNPPKVILYPLALVLSDILHPFALILSRNLSFIPYPSSFCSYDRVIQMLSRVSQSLNR